MGNSSGNGTLISCHNDDSLGGYPLENYREDQDGNLDLEEVFRAYTRNPTEEKMSHLIEAGKGLILHFAGIFSGEHANDDLIQVGYEGLLKAVDRFDPSKNTRFVTYASHCIMSEIRHELRREKSFYCPVWIVELQAQIIKASDEFVKEKGEMPSIEDIARLVNVNREGVLQAMRAGRVPFEELDLGKIRSKTYQPFQLPLEDRISIQEAIRKLSTIQRKVIYYIFYRDMTQTQTAEQLNINQRKVSRILKKAIDEIEKDIS